MLNSFSAEFNAVVEDLNSDSPSGTLTNLMQMHTRM